MINIRKDYLNRQDRFDTLLTVLAWVGVMVAIWVWVGVIYG